MCTCAYGETMIVSSESQGFHVLVTLESIRPSHLDLKLASILIINRLVVKVRFNRLRLLNDLIGHRTRTINRCCFIMCLVMCLGLIWIELTRIAHVGQCPNAVTELLHTYACYTRKGRTFTQLTLMALMWQLHVCIQSELEEQACPLFVRRHNFWRGHVWKIHFCFKFVNPRFELGDLYSKHPLNRYSVGHISLFSWVQMLVYIVFNRINVRDMSVPYMSVFTVKN